MNLVPCKVVGVQSLGSTTVTVVKDGQLVVQGPDQAAATRVAKLLSTGAAKLGSLNGKQILLLAAATPQEVGKTGTGKVETTPVPGPANPRYRPTIFS
jgi:hypothetical protein